MYNAINDARVFIMRKRQLKKIQDITELCLSILLIHILLRQSRASSSCLLLDILRNSRLLLTISTCWLYSGNLLMK